MSEAVRWWLILLLAGVVTLPLCLATFRRLPDRGYTLAKPFSLLVLGFTFWFLNSIRVLPNHSGGILAALMLLGVVAGLVAWHNREELRAWFEEHWQYVLSVEVAFLVVFAVAVWLRSFVGTIEYTEQPMDLMFLNAADQAKNFPPEDPWLSGNGVAYYYFGYLIVAMVGKLSGVPTEYAYNIGFAMVAALTIIAGFGLAYNLVRLREDVLPRDEPPGGAAPRRERQPSRRKALVSASEQGAVTQVAETSVAAAPIEWKPVTFGIAGAFLLAIMGSLTWVLKFASAYGIGGQGFYDWINVQGIVADEPRKGWYPNDFFGFFDGTRIYPLQTAVEDYVITEWPMFSFVLGDLHPHVMALPFVLLAGSLALAFYQSDEPLDLTYWLQRPLLLFGAAIMLGALGFLNTWDVATMSFVLVAAVFAASYLNLRNAPPPGGGERRSLGTTDWAMLAAVAAVSGIPTGIIIGVLTPGLLMVLALVAANAIWVGIFAAYLTRTAWAPIVEAAVRTISFAVPLVLLAVVLYLPFYRSFTSQADGLLPVVTNDGVSVPGTRPLHAFLYWGPLFLIVLPFIGVRLAAMRERIVRRDVIAVSAVPLTILIAWFLGFAFHKWRDTDDLRTADNVFTQIIDRGVGWITVLLFAGILCATLLTLWYELTSDGEREKRRGVIFTLLLASTAFLLIIGTEFFYVGDVFNSRMNTVFKLYYQAWLLLALAGAFSLYYLFSAWDREFRTEGSIRLAWGIAAAVVIAGGALYPLGATFNRTEGFDKQGELAGLHNFSADDQAAFKVLRDLAVGQDIVIAEAVGGDYWTNGPVSRVSAATGAPSVIGWVGHENQWRGSGAAAVEGRFQDVETLFRTADLDEARRIIDKYGVTYIYVGDFERQLYGADPQSLAKFNEFQVAFNSGGVTVYRAEGVTAEESTAP